ncbi:MAG: leucine-rich repeat domain-containing protein, partial [Alphaproteobacteria bacterium]|nr:leucine-rich repeat domain-containing protein [Alphaproteobacteria bacterium]
RAFSTISRTSASSSVEADEEQSLSDYIHENGFFSLQAVDRLESLSQEQKLKVLAPFGHDILLSAPRIPMSLRAKAFVTESLSMISSRVSPTLSKARQSNEVKRDREDISSKDVIFTAAGEKHSSGATNTKRQRTNQGFKTHTQELDSMSASLKEIIEDTLAIMPPYPVKSLSAFNAIVRATDYLTVHSVDMSAPMLTSSSNRSGWLNHWTPDRWSDAFVESLEPAIKEKRIRTLNLKGNRVTSKLVGSVDWNGLQMLDLSYNQIGAFGRLLQSEIQTLNLRGNRLYGVYQDERPETPNSALEVLDVSKNLFLTLGMETMLHAVARLPQLRVLKLGSKTKGLIDGSCLEKSFDVTHPNLEELSLKGWNLSRTSMAYILRLPRLHTLDLRHIQMEKGGFEALQMASPSLQIILSSDLMSKDSHRNDLMLARKKGVRIQVYTQKK